MPLYGDVLAKLGAAVKEITELSAALENKQSARIKHHNEEVEKKFAAAGKSPDMFEHENALLKASLTSCEDAIEAYKLIIDDLIERLATSEEQLQKLQNATRASTKNTETERLKKENAEQAETIAALQRRIIVLEAARSPTKESRSPSVESGGSVGYNAKTPTRNHERGIFGTRTPQRERAVVPPPLPPRWDPMPG